jgi:hypothetical protein
LFGRPSVSIFTDSSKDIKLAPNTYTHLFINFGVFMLPPATLPTSHSLLKASGFIGITTWSSFAWIRLVAQAIDRLPEPRPYCPSDVEIEVKIYQGRAWNKPQYVAKALEDAGFENVQVQEADRDVEVGTPEQFMEPMGFPLSMISTWWPEEDRENTLENLKREMLELVKEMAEGVVVRMKFAAILGSGWKAS